MTSHAIDAQFAARRLRQQVTEEQVRQRDRDTHLFGPGPKRILALDGGGVRGMISIAFVKRIEEILRARFGDDPDFRLCDYFDLFAGTSTGAILAASLATGKSASELEALYAELAPKVFGGRFAHLLQPFEARFSPQQLYALLCRELGPIDLSSNEIKSGLAIVTKRVDTDSAWVVTNNPRNPFWDDRQEGSFVSIGNKRYELAAVVRASTAAPYFFPPQEILVREGADGQHGRDDFGLFLDGGVTPHNNPSLMALMVARLKGHRLEWEAGPDKLLIISVGTGSWRNRIEVQKFKKVIAAWAAITSLTGLIRECERSVLTTMEWLSASPRPIRINSEIGDLGEEFLGVAPLCTYQRYDVELAQDYLCRPEISLNIDDHLLEAMRDMTRTTEMPLLRELGKRAAAAQVQPMDFPSPFDRFA
jgi:hypothetical protein